MPDQNIIKINDEEFKLENFYDKNHYFLDDDFNFNENDDSSSSWDKVYLLENRINYLINRIFYENTGYEKNTLIEKLVENIKQYILLSIDDNKYILNDDILCFLKVLLVLNKDKDFMKIIFQYYNELYILKYSEIVKRLDLIIRLAQLCFNAGDKVLLNIHNFQLAVEFYRLYLLGIEICENKFKHIDKNTENNFEWVSSISHFFYDESLDECDICILEKYQIKGMLKKYKNIKEKVNSCDSSKDIIQSIDEFVEDYGKSADILNDEETKQIKYRTFLLLYYSLQEKCFIFGLCSLCNEEKSIQNKYSKNIIELLRNNENQNLLLLSNYIKEQDEREENLIYYEILILGNIIFTKNKIMNDLLVEDRINTGNHIAYYTSLENFLYMLPSKCKNKNDVGKLSVMNISYMNDPNEGKILLNYLEVRDDKKINQRRDIRTPYVFFKSFISQIDYLPMWEMYSNHSQGCCIVIDWHKTKEYGFLNEIPLYNVFYIKNNHGELQIDNQYNTHITNSKNIKEQLEFLKDYYCRISNPITKVYFKKIISDLQYLIKEASYSYEQEMRIIYSYLDISSDFHHTDGENPLLFIHPDFALQIDEIILGPKFENVAMRIPFIQEEVAKMCQQIGSSMPVISISDIDFR